MTGDEQERFGHEEGDTGGDVEAPELEGYADEAGENHEAEAGQENEELLNAGSQPEEDDKSAKASVEYRGADGKMRTDEIAYEDVVALLEGKAQYEAANQRAEAAERRLREMEIENAQYKNDNQFAQFVLRNDFLNPIVHAVVNGKQESEIIDLVREHFDNYEQAMNEQENLSDEGKRLLQLERNNREITERLEQERQQREMQDTIVHNEDILAGALESLGMTYDAGRDNAVFSKAAEALGYNRGQKLNEYQAKNLLRTAQEMGGGKAFTAKQTAQPKPAAPLKQPPRQVPGQSANAGKPGTQSGPIRDPEQERRRRIEMRSTR